MTSGSVTRRIYAGTFPGDAQPKAQDSEALGPGASIYGLEPFPGLAARTFELRGPYLDAAFLALGAVTGTLYAVHRTATGGGVSAWTIACDTAELDLVEVLDSGGAEPCHLCLSPSADMLFVANYRGSSVASYLLSANGRIRSRGDVVRHSGHGLDPHRQEAPHPHMVLIDPLTGHLLVPDLGCDAVLVYDVDSVTGRLTALNDQTVRFPAGSGPRHMAFFPGGDAAVVVNELASTVATLERKGEGFRITDVVGTAPEGIVNFPSAVRTSPDGDLVYVANRGDDTVATFRRGASGHGLSPVSRSRCGGQPRDVIIDVDMQRLLVANHDTNTVATMGLSEGGLPDEAVPGWTVPNASSLVVWAGRTPAKGL